MSRIATDWVWNLELKPASLKLLLLSMADRADEYHCCFPSVARLVRDTGLNEKTVNTNIQKLVSSGVIEDTGRRRGSTGRVKVYRIIGVTENCNTSKTGSIRNCDSAAALGITGDGNTPENGNITNIGGIGKNGCSNTPKTGSMNTPENGSMNTPKNGSQNQSLEPPIEPTKKLIKKLDFSTWPQMPSEQTLDDWFAMRKRMRADVTQTVVNRLATQLQIAVSKGLSVDDCLAEIVMRNWRGFEYDWLSDEVKARGRVAMRAAATDEPGYAETGVITAESNRKDVSEAIKTGLLFHELPENHKQGLLDSWRVGRLPLELVSILEKQGVFQ